MAGPIVVLVVEDDPFIRMNLVYDLEQDGFTIYEAPNSQEALEALDAPVAVDCLVTDVDLGAGMDGLGLASRVRQSHPELHVIVVSGQRRLIPADLPRARFFIKPYDTGIIAEAVRELVGTKISALPNT